MALTQVKTTGIADDAVTEAKVANDAIGIAEMKTGTDGQIITYNASGNPTTVGPGTDGQVLTSTGAGSPPAFETLPASNNYVHPNHSGEVTSTADGAQVIADDVVDEANLKVSNSPTNGYFLSAQSGNTGGLTWAEAGGGKILKVAYGTNSTNYATTSTYPQDAFTFTFTPTSATSTVVIHMTLPIALNIASAIQLVGNFAVCKNDNTVLTARQYSQQHDYKDRNESGHAPTCQDTVMLIAKDTPGSTSQQTYKIRYGQQSGYGHRVAIRDHEGPGGAGKDNSAWAIFEYE